jgi:hypothetical protein
MKLLLALTFLFVAAPAIADAWTSTDTKREVTFQTLAAIDWLQTRNIARDPNKYWEQYTAVLGNHPSVGRVNNTFAVYMIGHYIVSRTLTEKYRAPFQYVTISIEVGDVYHNFSIGINAKF